MYSKKGVVVLVKKDGRTLITNLSSINEVEETLLSHDFFRLNRQVIAQTWAIKAYEAIENNKLSVQLCPDIPLLKGEIVTISRHKSVAFKKWFSTTCAQVA